MSTTKAATTVVIVPRETFSGAAASLDSILGTLAAETPVVYVDGGSPRAVRRYVERAAREKGFTHVRTEWFLTPNEARNLAMAYVDTEYVLFADNDLIPSPGWVEALERCAEETGAWAVGPLYFIGNPASQRIHMAGGEAHIIEEDGKFRFINHHHHEAIALGTLDATLSRARTEQLEFHCMLLRRDIFEKIGPLDEGLMSMLEHVDICMRVTQHGGEVWFEPGARVTYKPGSMTVSDLPYFLLRWSTGWNERSRETFLRAWRLSADDRCVANEFAFCEDHRRSNAYGQLRPLIGRLPTGRSRAQRLYERFGESVLVPWAVWRGTRRRRRARQPVAIAATPKARQG